MKASEYCIRVFDGTHDTPKPKEHGHLLITSKNIADGQLDLRDAYFISEEDYNQINKRSQVHQWDVLFSMIGTVGSVYLETNNTIDYAIKNMGVFSCGDRAKAQWLYYYLQSPTFKSVLNAQLSGAIQKFVPLQFLRDLDIPSLDENSGGIVNLLCTLDRKIALNRKANEVLESMAKQLYDYWFVQFDFPNAEGKPYKSSGGKMVYNEKLKRDIPEGWEVKQLAELTKDEMESICPCDTPDVMFKHYSIPAFDDCASYALEKGDTILSNKFVPTDNDILVSKLNPWTSRVIWCTEEEDAICSTEFVSLAPKNHDEKGFFYMLAKSNPFITYCTKASTGTSHSHRRVNPEIMKMFILPYKKDIISAYSKIVSNYIEKSVKHTQENKKLQSLRDYLLPLLMNGQVKVS